MKASLRPFGAPAWLRVGKRSKKGRRRGQRCLLLGYAGDVDKGYRVINLATRKIVTDVDVTVSTDLSPVRDFITSMRMDPFFAGVQGNWVWKLFDREPRARMLGVPVVEDDGSIIDQLGVDGQVPWPGRLLLRFYTNSASTKHGAVIESRANRVHTEYLHHAGQIDAKFFKHTPTSPGLGDETPIGVLALLYTI